MVVTGRGMVQSEDVQSGGDAGSRKVIHIDMDCFFAAVEMRDRPDLRGVPLAVGGSPDGRGVVATCNYAARAFGVRSAMPAREARRRCPDLVFVTPDMSRYQAESQRVMALCRDFAEVVEVVSVDEAYLDVTASPHQGGSATRIAQALRARIVAETGLTASAGVGPNKLIAKIASDINKPDGLCVVPPARALAFMTAQPVARIPGVGRVAQRRLAEAGVSSCGDLQRVPLTTLEQWFGQFGKRLHAFCRGQDLRPVQAERIRKSVSVEHTSDGDCPASQVQRDWLPRLFSELQQRLARLRARGQHYRPTGAFVKVRFADFHTTTLERTGVPPDVRVFGALFRAAAARSHRPIRLLGLGVRVEPVGPGELVPEQLFFELPTD